MTIKFNKSDELKKAQENWKKVALKTDSTQEDQQVLYKIIWTHCKLL
nr:hypothetical protein [Vibrio coralliilyticus]